MFAWMTMLRLLADLGLERSPNAQRGLFVWAGVFVLCALLTLFMWRHGARRQSQPSPELMTGTRRGRPFMKRTFLAVVQVASGILAVYALGRLTEPSTKR